ncbi:MAG: hypothetical protein VX642_13055 [Bdellovibrionota bacterium]|nr:hypothetical protein [Bdellovibrionota bacterium]
MLIHCPKCNFEQPKDDFCAKCGVHIPSYKAPEDNIQQKALKSAGFYGFLFLCLFIGSGYYFYSKYNGFEKKIEEYNIEQLNALRESDPEKFEELEQTQIQDDTGVVEELEATINEVMEKNAGPKSIKNPVIESLNWAEYQITLLFLEGPDVIEIPEMEERQSGANYVIYKLPAIPEVLNNFSILNQQFSEVRADSANNQIVIETPYPDGSSFSYNLKWVEESNRLRMEIISSFQIVQEENIASALSFSDYLKPGQWLLLKGFLPQVPFDIATDNIFPPFNIFRSEYFVNGESNFYILLQITKIN